MNTTFYSLLFGLSSESGHLLHYHRHLEKAIRSLRWEFHALIPKQTKIKQLPNGWQPCLAIDPWDGSKTIFDRISSFFFNLSALRKLFRSISTEQKAIVFLESFEMQQLASLVVSLLCTRKPKCHIWILHRYHYAKNHYKAIYYRIMHWFLEKKLGSFRIQYITDSDLLALSQQTLFKRKVTIVPIPHTFVHHQETKEDAIDYFWWPGSSLSEQRGLIEVISIAKELVHHCDTKLVVSQRAKGVLPPSPRIVFLPNELSRQSYQQWMRKAAVVLLPYCSVDYAQRTSGIFVEAICAGAMPVTKKGTWMAYELKKFGLERLILDWGRHDVVDQLLLFRQNRELMEALHQMREAYRLFHSETSFAKTVSMLAETV